MEALGLLLNDLEQCIVSVSQMDSDSSNGELKPATTANDNAIVESEQESSSVDNTNAAGKILTKESSMKDEANPILEKNPENGK